MHHIKKYTTIFLILIISFHLVGCSTSRRTAGINSTRSGYNSSNNTTTHPITDAKQLKKKYADILHISSKQIDNIVLYKFIDDWMGTPYHLGGTNKVGIDCSGFAKKLYEEVYHTAIVRSSPEQYKKYYYTRKVKKLQEGELIFFYGKTNEISHVGVYLDNYYFVHASTTTGVRISSMKEEYWSQHFAGVGRVK
jgi:lipoprotein Spr